jgi:hypothetical protein
MHLGGGVNVANVGSNTGGVDNVKESKVGDGGLVLEEKREGLADTASGTEDGNLAVGLEEAFQFKGLSFVGHVQRGSRQEPRKKKGEE